MRVRTYTDRKTMSQAAALHVARALRAILATRVARMVAATGASQIAFLEALTAEPGIDWSRVELFHLDEYVGLSINHPASFRKYLLERLIGPVGIRRYHLLDGEHDAPGVAREVGCLLAAQPVDLALVGIGENGHLAFNDPPADFETATPYLIVTLDEACRRQQVGEGWFARLDDVPSQAISMSIRQILSSVEIIGVVPDSRKANAVTACLDGAVSPAAPASILQTHRNTTIYLDQESAALLPLAIRGQVLESAHA